MATKGGSGSDDLGLYGKLGASPTEHHLFQALRIIEAAHPDAPRLGESRRPREDKVRLAQEAELSFPTSTISSFVPPKGVKPGVLTNRMFGFFGPNGPLPLHLTEYARDRQRNVRDNTFVAFANMLTHRMMSLLYRAWANGQPTACYDRTDDPMARKVSALAGYHGKHLTGRDAMPDDARRHFAAHLASEQKTAEGLVALVSSFFQVPVEIEQFVGTWLDLEPEDTWQLGRPAGLGQTTSIGNRVWSRSSKFRLRIGPLKMEDYQRLLPGGDSLRRLRSVVRTYVGDAMDWDVNLILVGDDVPRSSLSGTTRLGHTSWVRSRNLDDDRPDADDLYLYPADGGTAPPTIHAE